MLREAVCPDRQPLSFLSNMTDRIAGNSTVFRRILFICTGNYYRSRYAEAYFNFRAGSSRIPWAAFSRGLHPEAVTENNELSVFTLRELQRRRIPLHHTGERRVRLSLADLKTADRVIALKRDEHLDMMRSAFPAWADRIEYWAVHDLDQARPETALAEITELVETLHDELKNNRPKPANRKLRP